jgi:hypothetical protein
MKPLLLVILLALSSLACTLSSAQISANRNSQQPAIASIPPKSELENATNSTPTAKTTSATVTALETVYIRLKPNSRAEILGYLTHGAIVAIYSCDGEWALIGPDMYVNSHYLSVRCK